jgi:hypothetical protein
MRHRLIVTIIMLGLWPLLVTATVDGGAEAARSVPRAQCDPVPLSGLARPDVPLLLAQHQASCACPPLECPDGTVEPCEADCFQSDVPVCQCEAWCDADGIPRGRNVCECH